MSTFLAGLSRRLSFLTPDQEPMTWNPKTHRLSLLSAALGLLFALPLAASAYLTNRWDFTNPSDYIFSASNQMEVAGGTVHLTRNIRTVYHASSDFYFTNDTERSQISVGPQSSISLSKSGASFNPGGIFTSRVMDRGPFSSTWQALVTRVSNRNLPSENSRTELVSGLNGLIGLWHLNNDMNDAIAGNNGTATKVTFDTAAKFGSQSAFFDATKPAYAVMPRGYSFPNSQMTISFWVKARYSDQQGIAFPISFKTAGNVFLGVYLGGQLVNRAIGFTFFPGGGDAAAAGTFTDATDQGKWRHIVVVYNAAASPATTIYKDAVALPLAQKLSSGPVPDITDVQFGRRGFDGRFYYDGNLDEVALFNRALTREEVVYLYQLGSPLKFRVKSSPTPDMATEFVGFDGGTNSYFLDAVALFPTNGGFNLQDRYVQYQAFMDPSTDRTLSPQIEAVAFLGSRVTLYDYTLSDYQQGTIVTNMVLAPARRKWSCLGLVKKPDGGYYADGTFISRPMTPGGQVVWDRISWDACRDEVPNNQTGLIGLWPMNGTWSDASGRGHTGSPLGASFTPFAKVGLQSGSFDGASSVTFGNVGSVRTVEFWVSTTQPGSGLVSLNGGNEPAIVVLGGYVQALGMGRAAQIFINGSDASSALRTGWNHVVVTLDAGVAAPNLVIGLAGGYNLRGTMDDLAVYSRALTTADIKDHYESGRRQIAGRARLQIRAANTEAELANLPFTGPGGSTNAYYLDPQGAVLTAPDTAWIQYRVLLEGDGNATPAVGSVTITHTSSEFPSLGDYTDSDIQQGTSPGERTWWYGEEISSIRLAAVGPFSYSGAGEESVRGIWHMDELWGVGPTVIDASGNGRNGSAEGGAQTIYDAKVGLSCGSFDGTNDYVSVPPVSDLGSADFTLALWFRSTTTNRCALVSSYDAQRYYTIELNGDGQGGSTTGGVAFVIDDGSSGAKATVSLRAQLNDGRWHHVAGVRRGSLINVYVDGDRSGTTEIGNVGNVGASAILFFAKYGISSIFYQGSLDEVVFFKRALNDGEIGDLAAAGYQVSGQGTFTGPIVDGGQPVVWNALGWGASAPSSRALIGADAALSGLWHFDADASDVSPFGNNGVLSSATIVSGGVFSNSVNFPIAGGRVTVPDSASLERPQFSVEVWVKPSVGGAQSIIDKRDAAAGYALFTGSDGILSFWLAGTEVKDTLPLNVREWSHVLASYDGSYMYLYVNGACRAQAAPASVQTATANPLKFGESYTGNQHFTGQMDEAAYFSRALEPEEIIDHYRMYAVVLRFQARSGNSLPLTGPFVGPGTQPDTYFTDFTASDLTRGVPTARYFQYRAYLDTLDFKEPPAVRGIRVNIASYSTINPSVEPAESAAFTFPGTLLGFGQQRNEDVSGTTAVKYQISGDAGSTNRWFYWDESAATWALVNTNTGPSEYEFQTSPPDVVAANIGSFFEQIYSKTGGRFRFKAFMHSLGDQPVEIDWVQVSSSEGRIVIAEPNGAETNDNAWLTGVPYEIRWDYAGNVAGNVRVEYSTDGGATWNTVAASVPANTGRVPWTTPDLESDNVLVRIVHLRDGTLRDTSDSPFQLVKRFRVVDPNGGTNQVWYVGETNTIVWDAARGLASVNIDYSGFDSWPAGIPTADSTNPVAVVHFLSAAGGARSNEYVWVIPTTNSGLPSTTAKIRIQTPGGGFSDYSDQFFTMAGAAFVRPGFGEKTRRGQLYPLTWRSAGCGPTVSIYTRSRSGDEWSVVATNVPNVDGLNTYTWTITNSPSEEAMVRIQSDSNPRAIGQSAAFIVAAIDILSPYGHPDPAKSEKWLTGSTQTVVWVSAGASDFVNLRYSVDNGSTWSLLAENYPNSGTETNYYTWVVPATPSARTRVRVEDASAPEELWTMSPYNFHIAGVTITFPNGPLSQEWKKGVADAIRWQQDAVGDNALVELSDDGGVTWTNVAPGGGLVSLIDGATPPYIPMTPTVRGLARITAENPAPFTNIFDVSDSFFTIAGIRVDRPLGTDRYTIGTTNVIQFIAAGTHDADGTVDFFYAADGVRFDTANPIARNVVFSEAFPGVNVYRWNIEPTREPSYAARVKVVAGAYEQVSDPFAVRGISFRAPRPGDLWTPGLQTIRWGYAGLALESVVDIYASTDGATFSKLNADGVLLTSGSFQWNIPQDQDPSTNAVLRIVITNSTDAGFTANSLPFVLQGIKIVEPAAGTAWELGQTQTIRWYAAAAGETMDLFYSPDGTNYDTKPIEQVVASHDGLNQYSWAIETTRIPSAAARIKLVSNTGISRESVPFEMRGIRILKPTGRSVYARTDATNLITWAAVGDNGPYRLEYYTNGVGPALIANAPAGTSQYNWSIPVEAVSSNVVVRITGVRYSNTSESFQIVSEPTIFVVSPEPGAYWQIGRQYTIDWSRGGDMENDFTVWYVHSGDGFAASNVIASGAEITYDPVNNSFTVPWTVPDRPGQARIIVRNNVSPTIADESDTFSLVGRFEIRTPNGGDQLFALKPTPVVWRTIGSVPAVDLYYSVTPPYRAGSWIKINASPIVNNFNGSLAPEQTSYNWPAANIPYTTTARVRVQEASYTNLFDAGQPGPYDDSDLPFGIRYYTIFWEVYDQVTGDRLDKLSVADSSGWSEGSLSSTNTISHDYPWGIWNTVWYREFFHDQVVFGWNPDNLQLGGIPVWTQKVYMTRATIEQDYHVMANFNYDIVGKAFRTIAWLERGASIIPTPTKCLITVYDGSGNIAADVSPNPVVADTVLPNGTFNKVWDASRMQQMTVYFAKVDIEFSGVLYSSGLTFTLQLPAGDTSALQALIANAEQNILGSVGGVSNQVEDVHRGVSSLQSGMTDLTAMMHDATGRLVNIQQEVSGLSTTVVGAADQIVAVAGPLSNMTARIDAISEDSGSALARILTRPTTVEYGQTFTVLFKSRRGYANNTVRVEVTREGVTYNEEGMAALVAGIYQSDLTANWGTNSYTITCTDPATNRDSMVVEVVPPGSRSAYEVALLVSNQLRGISTSIADFTNITWSAISNVAADMAAIKTSIGSVDWGALTNVSTNMNALTAALGNMNWADISNMWKDVRFTTNQLAGLGTNITGDVYSIITNALGDSRLNGLSNIAENVDRLASQFASVEWGALTNVSRDMAAMTSVLNRVNWDAIAGMSTDMATITQRIGNIQWSDIAALTATVNGFTNQIGAINWSTVEKMAGDMANITNRIGNIQWSDINNLTTNVAGLTRVVSNVNWSTVESMAKDMSTITNRIGSINWDDITRLIARVDLLSTNVGGLSGVISNVNWSTVEKMAGDMADITNRIGSINWDDIVRLTGRVDNLATNVGGLGSVISNINWATVESMAKDMATITNRIGDIQWSDIVRLTDNVAGLSNEVAKVPWSTVASMAGDMATITQRIGNVNWNDILQLQRDMSGLTTNVAGLTRVISNVNWSTVEKMAGDMSNITNRIGSINWDDITRLTARVDLLSTNVGGLSGIVSNVPWDTVTRMAGDMASITQRIGTINWDDIVRLTARVDLLATNVSGLGGTISNVNWDAVANMAKDMATITNRIGDIQWSDIVKLTQNVAGLSNEIAGVNWTAVASMADDMATITNRIGSINWDDITRLTARVDLLSTNVGGLSGVISNVPWDTVAGMAKDMATITNAIGKINWGDIVALTTNVNGLTRAVTNVDWATMAGMADDMATITNRIGSINWGDITVLSTNVGSLVDVMNRVNWNAITNISSDMALITNRLGDIRWSDVTLIASNVTSLSSQFGAVNWNSLSNVATELRGVNWGAITNLSGNMQFITNALGDMRWSEIRTMATNVLSVQKAVSGMSWADIQGIKQNVSDMDTKLGKIDLTAGGAAQQMLDIFDQRLGKTTDSSGATVFGRLTTIEHSLSSVGADASQAAKKARTAKTEAANASSGIQEVRQAIKSGNLADLPRQMDHISASVSRAEREILSIPEMIGPPAVFDQMRRTAQTIEKFAKSKGFEYLLSMKELPTGTGPGTAEQQIILLNSNIEEMKGSLLFMQKLVDEMRYEPVQETSLLGAP